MCMRVYVHIHMCVYICTYLMHSGFWGCFQQWPEITHSGDPEREEKRGSEFKVHLGVWPASRSLSHAHSSLLPSPSSLPTCALSRRLGAATPSPWEHLDLK